MFICNKCNVGFASQTLLNNHLKKITQCDVPKPKFVCKHCERPYSSSGHLNRHIKTKHPDSIEYDDDTDISMCDVKAIQSALSKLNTKLVGVSLNGIICDIDINYFYNYKEYNIGPCSQEEYFKQFMAIFADDECDENCVKQIIERCQHIPSNNYLLTGGNVTQMTFNPITNKGVINNYYNAFTIIDHNRPQCDGKPHQDLINLKSIAKNNGINQLQQMINSAS